MEDFIANRRAMADCILALDQGTTSSRAIVFDAQGAIVSVAQQEFEQIFPQPGWVEHNPDNIWQSQLACAREALSNARIAARDVAAIGITNQRETTIVWDRKTGRPIYNAIVWQDRRTAGLCDELRARGLAAQFQAHTGLVLDAYFSGTKVKWILDNVPDARRRAQAGELAFGTVDSWLAWNLTGGRVHATDVTNASRTLLFDIHTLGWSDSLISILDIPEPLLPTVCPTSAAIGVTEAALLGASIPIGALVGDQQAALFGQMCLQPGMAKNTYGTGCFMLMNAGDKPIASQNQLLTTVAWQRSRQSQPTLSTQGSSNNETLYALEGSIFIAGAVVQWLRDGLGVIQRAGDVEALAASVADNGGVVLVPAFAGLGAPHWDGHARGAILGLTRGASKAHLARAALESIALQTADVLDAMQADAALPLAELRVDGGATANNLLMQIQADVLGVSVVRPKVTETTALGAAYLAGLAVGFWPDAQALSSKWQVDRRFEPNASREWRDKLRTNWRKAVERAKAWV
jgi:glycerol kinase